MSPHTRWGPLYAYAPQPPPPPPAPPWHALEQGTPAWVCTTNDGLDSVLEHTAVTQAQLHQLIFVQNGMLLPWLKQHGLERNTQVLLYMSGEGTQLVSRRKGGGRSASAAIHEG
jgi:hypothetical protein